MENSQQKKKANVYLGRFVLIFLLAALFVAVYTLILQKNYKTNTLEAAVERDVECANAIHTLVSDRFNKADYDEINTRADMDTPRYQELQQSLNELRTLNSTRYLYTAKRNSEGKLIYLVDGLDLGAEDFAYPGTYIEDEMIPYIDAALEGENVYSQDIMDTTWGHIFTACYPVRDNETNEIIGALCIEMDMEPSYLFLEKINNIAFKAAVVAAFVIVLIIILLYRSMQKQKQKDIAQQEKLESEMITLQNIHRAIGSGAWKLQYNEQGEMISCKWSDTMRHMLGFESTEDFPDEFESWIERLHPEDKEYALKEYSSTVKDYSNQKKYDIEYRVCDKSGVYRWFRAAGELSRRADGSPIAFDGVFIDTDELHKANENLHRALQETERARNELLLEHEVISAVSREYFAVNSIDLVHDMYEEISGHDGFAPLVTVQGENAQIKLDKICTTLVAKEYQNSVMNFFDLSTVPDRMQDSDVIEIEYFATDGNWHQARFIEKKRNQEGRVTDVLYVTRIVSKEKQREIEQERLRIAYQVAERANEAKTTFLLNMSHDIRTPMNAIIGYSKLMREHISDPELLHYQEMIEQSGNVLLSIINNVLDMARIESGKMELDENYSETGNIVGGICSVFEMEAQKKNLTMKHYVNVEHTHIICDTTKMQEILTNIISNAVKYTPPGGTVTITTDELPCEKEGYINIRTVVEDNGIGISEEFLPHLFDSFSRERDTTSAKVSGTGLGMAIVKSLVDLMGGSVTVESELGKGTKFTVTIPHKIASEEYYEKKALAESMEDVNFSGKHILLAEDNDINAEIATLILEEMGFAVDRVEDGIICVNKLEKEPAGTYDLILMDIQMPNMDGYKAAKMIRHLPNAAKAHIPIVAMTANAFAEDRKKAFEAGTNGHIAKPIDASKIKETLAQILK